MLDGLAQGLRRHLLRTLRGFLWLEGQKEFVTASAVASACGQKLGAPLSGVHIELDNGLTTETDADGKFSFKELPPGARKVTLSRADLKALQTQETVVAGEKLQASYEVDLAPPQAPANADDADDLELVIVLPTLTKQVVSVKVDADQARRVAGT